MNAVRISSELQTAERFVRDLFERSPWLSIDEVARLCYQNCKRSLNKGALSRIRATVRQEKMARGEPVSSYASPVKPFNPPHLTTESHVQPATAEDVKEVQTQTFAPSSKLERSTFLSEWATQNPTATIAQARSALFKKFGMAISTAYIADTLKVARQLAGLEKPTNAPAVSAMPTVEEHVRAAVTVSPKNFIEELVQKMKENGVRKLEIKDDGTYMVELGGRVA